MSTSPGVVTAVRWNEICPWLLLVRAARVALFARVIALATAGVLVTQWGWTAIEGALLPAEGVEALARLTDHPWPPIDRSASAAMISPPFGAVNVQPWSGPLLRGWAWAVQPLARLASADGWQAGVAFVLAGAWGMAVWALVGGAIARIAALYLARGELIGPVAALRSAATAWVSTIAAPSFCVGVVAIFAVLLALVGLVSRLGLFAFLAGLAWPIPLLIGAAIAVFALGLLVGWPLMWSTIAAERTDAFDGVSRGYAFSFQRPLHLVFFVLVATALGLLAQAAVSVVVDGSIAAMRWGVGLGANEAYANALFDGAALPDERKLGMLEAAGGNAMQFWIAGAQSLARSFPMAYLFPAAMGIYLLLRQLIDSTELGEVALDEPEPEKGLPPLGTDFATGVPTMPPPPVDGTATTTVTATATVTEMRGGST